MSSAPLPATASTHPPEWLRRAAVTAAGMCAFFTMYVTQGLLPTLQREFGASVAELSLTITVTTLAVALAAPFAGVLSDRYGRKRVLLVSVVLLGLSTGLAGTARDLHGLLVWRAIGGLCIPGVFTSAVAYIGEEWPPSQAPAVTALYISGSVAGGFFGRFIAGMVTAHAGWPTAFVALGAVNLLLAALMWRGLPASTRFQASRGGVGDILRGFARHLRNRKLLGTYAIGFGILFSQVCTFTYVSFHLAAPPYDFDLKDLSLLFTVYLVGMVVTPLAGRLGARFGQRPVFVAAVAAGAAGMVLTLLPPVAAIVVGLTLSSAGVFIAQSMATSLVPRFAREARSAAVGLYVMLYYIGGSVGASAPSAIWHDWGWAGCVALVLLVQAGIGAAAWATWRDGATASAR